MNLTAWSFRCSNLLMRAAVIVLTLMNRAGSLISRTNVRIILTLTSTRKSWSIGLLLVTRESPRKFILQKFTVFRFVLVERVKFSAHFIPRHSNTNVFTVWKKYSPLSIVDKFFCECDIGNQWIPTYKFQKGTWYLDKFCGWQHCTYSRLAVKKHNKLNILIKCESCPFGYCVYRWAKEAKCVTQVLTGRGLWYFKLCTKEDIEETGFKLWWISTGIIW